MISKSALGKLGEVAVKQVVAGRVSTAEPILANSLWKDNDVTVVFVIRRPGWKWCREEGLDLSNLQKSGGLGDAPLVGVIKEVGPQNDSSIEKDELGTRLFQQDYFSYPVYLDANQDFYKALGNRRLFSLVSWNPLTWWSSMKEMSGRTDARGIPGNLKGEGIVLGGVVVISKDNGVVYQYLEQTGMPVPVDEISAAVKKALQKE